MRRPTDPKKLARRVVTGVQLPRFVPHLLAYRFGPARDKVTADIHRWNQVQHREGSDWQMLVNYLAWQPEFRNLFYFRLGPAGRALSVLARPLPTFYIKTPRDQVGPGMYVQHGFATIITAKSIGKNFWVNQQVTVGYTNDDDAPHIGDDVTLGAGALVLGDVTVGDGATVGAGAVVVKDVPPESTVVGVPARAVRAEGV